MILLPLDASAFVPIIKSAAKTTAHHVSTAPVAAESTSEWLDVLKWDGIEPDFDVIELAKKYTSEPGYRCFNLKTIPTDYYSEDYIFRGPIVGPINRKDLVETNTGFGLDKAFPDLDRQPFGFAADPENPFRVLFFERWKATHTGEFSFNGLPALPVTGNRSISPVMPFSITFNPEGKIVYETLTTAVDRFEGNTKGKVAVFGLIESAGLSLDNNIGNTVLVLQQKFNRLLDAEVQIFSKEEDVPSWWKSKAVGAEKNDM